MGCGVECQYFVPVVVLMFVHNNIGNVYDNRLGTQNNTHKVMVQQHN